MMPKLKPTKEQHFMAVIRENLKLCCKVFGTAKIAVFMGVSEQTVYNRVKNPNCLTQLEIFRLSECTGIEIGKFTKPLEIGVKEAKT